MSIEDTLSRIAADVAEIKASLGIASSRPDPATALPVRDYTNAEVEQLRAIYPGLIRPQDFVKYRSVTDCASYLDSALKYFNVRFVSQLPDSVQSGELSLGVRYAGQFRANVPTDTYGAGV